MIDIIICVHVVWRDIIRAWRHGVLVWGLKVCLGKHFAIPILNLTPDVSDN